MRSLIVLAGLSFAPAAMALPWHVDMVDSDAVKAYERPMRALPEGVIAQPNLLTPLGYVRQYRRETAEGQQLRNPYEADDAALKLGQRMYGIYCTVCHGSDGINLGPVAQPGRYPAVAVLAGEQGRLKNRTDGHVYLTVRNGGGIMAGYGWAMNDREMWSIVSYMRAAFEDSAEPPLPEPEPEPETEDDGN